MAERGKCKWVDNGDGTETCQTCGNKDIIDMDDLIMDPEGE